MRVHIVYAPPPDAIYPSVDPPGTERELVAPFSPDEDATREDARRVAKMEPFITLPRILVADARSSWKPPVMHYGWLVPLHSVYRYAKAHDMVEYAFGHGIEWDPSVYDPTQDEPVEYATEEDRDIADMNVARTTLCVIYDIAERQNIRLARLRVNVHGVISDAGKLAISLYTNYNIPHHPRDELIALFRRELNLKQEPRWYLDNVQWAWNTTGSLW